jgi:hypothetical protein
MTQAKPTSKPPPKEEELEQAKRELEEACAQTEVASKKHEQAVTSLKKTISNPKLQAVKLPTPSQVELEAAKPPAK